MRLLRVGLIQGAPGLASRGRRLGLGIVHSDIRSRFRATGGSRCKAMITSLGRFD
jgi:hypothetical protein